MISNQLLAYKLLTKNSFGFKDYFNADVSNNGKKADDGLNDDDDDDDFDEPSDAITSDYDNIGDDSFFCGRPGKWFLLLLLYLDWLPKEILEINF